MRAAFVISMVFSGRAFAQCDMPGNPAEAPTFVDWSQWQRGLSAEASAVLNSDDNASCQLPREEVLYDAKQLEALCRKRAKKSPVANKTACRELCIQLEPFNNGWQVHQTVIKTLQQLNVRWATCGAVEKTAAQAWKCAGGKALPGGFTVERVEPESIRVSGAYREAGQRWVYEAVPSGGCGRAFRQVRQPAPVRTSLSGRVELIIESL